MGNIIAGVLQLTAAFSWFLVLEINSRRANISTGEYHIAVGALIFSSFLWGISLLI